MSDQVATAAAPAGAHVAQAASESAPAAAATAVPATAKKRVDAYDIAKGIGIIAIVFGHLSFVFNGSTDLAGIVYQFHVPIFFLLAGYLLSERLTMGKFIKAKAQRLLVPYAVACLLIIAVMAAILFISRAQGIDPTWFDFTSWGGSFKALIASSVYGSAAEESHTLFGVHHIGAIWFLQALFVGLVITRLCLKLGKGWAAIPIAILLVAAVESRFYVWLPFNLQSGCVAAAYIYVGFLFKQIRVLDLKPHVLVVIAAIAIVVLCYFIDLKPFPATADLTLYIDGGPTWLRYLLHYAAFPTSIMACYLVILISKLIDGHTHVLKRFFLYFGKGSLIVLCLHIVFMDCGFADLLTWLGVTTDFNIQQTVNLVIQLLVGAGGIALVHHVKWLQKIF